MPLDITAMIARDPRAACAKLSRHFASEFTIAAVARKLGVAPRTVKRWLSSLGAVGHPLTVPRARRGWTPGRPRGPAIARNFRGKKARPTKDLPFS